MQYVEGDKPAKKKFKVYSIGYFHIDIAEVQTDEGRLYLFVAIDRTSKFAYAERHPSAARSLPTNSHDQPLCVGTIWSISLKATVHG